MGQVWCCVGCEYTKPRWQTDQVTHLLEGGVKCVCGTKMELREGSTIAVQKETESDDRYESITAGEGESRKEHT